MRITFDGADTVISDAGTDLAKTLFCGQAFRFERCGDGEYTGVALGRELRLSERGGDVTLYDVDESEYRALWENYFDLARDYGVINAGYTGDPILTQGMEYARGIHILNQPPFETLISFIISANNNIGRITGIIRRLCALCGRQLTETAFDFPTSEAIASLTEEQLTAIGTGYRAPYILKTARDVCDCGGIDCCRDMEYGQAVERLCGFMGVGRKVADCVALFSLGFTQAFPLDVWMKRVLHELYDVPEKADMYAFISERFGQYAGIAQQYLFYYARENMPRKRR